MALTFQTKLDIFNGIHYNLVYVSASNCLNGFIFNECIDYLIIYCALIKPDNSCLARVLILHIIGQLASFL
jgi:hypothetical protein